MRRLTVRQRRRLARLDRALAGDAVLTKLAALFPEPEPARARARTWPWAKLWCTGLILAGVAATVVGVLGADVMGVGAAVAVACGATAIAVGTAFVLASVTTGGPVEGRAWPSPR